MSFNLKEREQRDMHKEDMKDLAKKKTLSEILSLMRASDEGMLELSPEEMIQLGEAKVEGYYDLITKYLSESARLSTKAKNFAAAAAAHAAQADRMKQALCYHMRENGITTLPGQDMKVTLRTSQRVVLLREDVVPDSPYVRVKYEWNKIELKRGLEAGDLHAEELAAFEESYWPDFDVKGLK